MHVRRESDMNFNALESLWRKVVETFSSGGELGFSRSLEWPKKIKSFRSKCLKI